MEKVLHKGFKYERVPEKYVFPPEERQKKLLNSNTESSIPVIDLAGAKTTIVNQILEAGKDFGIFQIVNHGMPCEVMSEMIHVTKEFFDMPFEERAIHYSEDLYKPVRLFTSLFTSTDVHDSVRLWRDCLRMTIYPVEYFKQYWPEKPNNLKIIMKRYAMEIKDLTTRVLRLIAEGLGLDDDYFNGDLSGESIVSHINFYPPCPDPSLTLGLAKHCDPSLITLLLQSNVSGLQILHNGEWVVVDPILNAIVVNYGHQMEFVSNGLLKGVDHRAITNEMQSRLSIATFIQPAKESLIAPAPKLLDENNPPLYKSFLFQDYFANYVAKLGDKAKSTEPFMLKYA